MEVETKETVEKEVAFTDAVVGFVVLANDGHYHADCEFCNGFGGVGGYTDDFDAEVGGGGEVYIVIACAAKGDVFLFMWGGAG